MSILPGIVASGFRQASEPGGPGVGEHRYWSILITSRVNPAATYTGLSEVEFWGSPWCERLRGTVTSPGGTGPQNTQNEKVTSGSGALSYWYSVESLPRRIILDLGAGNEREVGAVAIWRAGEAGAAPANFHVEYSDDGSTWTTAWSDTASYSASPFDGPFVSDNPAYSGPTDPVLDLGNEPTFWLDAALSFADEGTTPCADLDPVRQITNLGSEGTPFSQATLARRPIYRTDGHGGRPYLLCDRSEQHHLADIAWTNNSGAISVVPYLIGAAFDTSAPGSGETYALTGHGSASNGGKNALFFREPADAQVHIGKGDWRFGNVGTGLNILSAGVQWWTDAQARHIAPGESPVAVTLSGGGFASTEITSTQLLRSTVLADDGYFHGRLYELVVIANWPLGASETPKPVVPLHRMERYFSRKYGLA